MEQHAAPPGFYPFWFWNDELDAAEIRAQIAEMAAQGIRGFYIHPRQGLRVPYLSEAYFSRIAVALEAAREYGLVANLYDEYPYPSGVAGGQVVLGNPHFHATRLVQRSYDLNGGAIELPLPRGKVLCCLAYPIEGGEVMWERGCDLLTHVGTVLTDESYVETGLTQYNRKRYFASRPTPVLHVRLPEGPHRLYVAVQALVEQHKYWGHFTDVLNPDAVREFLSLTHERYRARFGHLFGTLIDAIFVDETAPGWSARLPEAFRAEYGYDLLPLLPALQERTHPEHRRVAADFHRLRYKLFCESFEKPIAAWCRAHGLKYASEKPVLRYAQLRYTDIPGCDPGHTKAGAAPDILSHALRANARAIASAAYFYDKPGSLCECYHSLGWSGTLQDAKWIAECLKLMGIDYLVPHAFFYSTHALRKHDAPPSFFFQMPYWPLFQHLTRRIDRIAQAFRGTHIDAEILVVEPESGLPSRDDRAAYGRLLQALMAAHLDFYVVDTDVLEAGSLIPGADGPRWRLKEVAARAILVPPMTVLEPALEARLAACADAGISVIRLERDADPAPIVERLTTLVPPALPLRMPEDASRCLWIVRRRGASSRLWFIVNISDRTVEFCCEDTEPLEEIPLDEQLPPLLARVAGSYRRRIRPFESVLIGHSHASASPARAAPPEIWPIPIGGRLAITPHQRNLLRLASWEMSLGGDAAHPAGPARVNAAPIANQLAESGLPFRPDVRISFGQAPELAWPRLEVRYRTSFTSEYAGPVWLAMEPGSIGGEWEIRL
ncbi:MAG TPA: glycosyl hydrolase, partial [Limnochordia bacterium]